MFGLFKSRTSPQQFGRLLLYFCQEMIATDAGRSQGLVFEDFGADENWPQFFVNKGISINDQKRYIRTFVHVALQAATTLLEKEHRLATLQGAMASYSSIPVGYDFDLVYREVEAVHAGTYPFPHSLRECRNPEAQVSWLPNPNAGVLNAKYLIERFGSIHPQNERAWLNNFESFSLVACSPIGTAKRAGDLLLKKHRIS